MKCHACSKGILSQKTKQHVFTYRGKFIKLDQPGLWCNSCEEGILNGEDIAKTEKSFDEFRSNVDG